MTTRTNARTLALLAVLLGVAGVGVIVLPGGDTARRSREPEGAAAGPQVAIPAESVHFQLVPPDKEKRSGLYAAALSYSMPSSVYSFSDAADGKLGKPSSTLGVVLIGKLPDVIKILDQPAACSSYDFFVPEAGSIQGNKITLPVKFVRWFGATKEIPGPSSVCFTVSLPPLAPGTYTATVVFEDYVCHGDRSKIVRPAKLANLGPRFPPMTCTFEVRAAAGAAAAEGIAWGEARNGLRA